jgi:hypothetical protein
MENIQIKINELKEIINSKIDKIDLKYRNGPSLYFYEKTIERRKKEKNIEYFLKNEMNIEYIYATLVAWDMDGRGARMKYFIEFKKSIKDNLKYFLQIENNGINILNVELNIILPILENIYKNIDIMQTNSKLVSLSKLLHGILKFLVQPDRIKQGGTNGVSKNYNGRAGGNISPAL